MPVDDDDVMLFNYNDAVLYQRDLRLVVDNEWLNDAVVHFYFEYLQKMDDCHSNYFMDSSVVSFFMHQCVDAEDIADFVSSGPFPKKRSRIFIAVNDQMSVFAGNGSDWMQDATHGLSAARGMHWSLLLITVFPSDNDGGNFTLEAFHFDSQGDCNLSVATEIATKIAKHVYNFLEKRIKEVNACKTPQQINGYDCGAHVLKAAQILADRVDLKSLKCQQDCENALQEGITRQHGGNPGPTMRREVASIVAELASQSGRD